MPRPRTHDWIDDRSLAFDQATLRHLREDPERVLTIARVNLRRWLQTGDPRTLSVLREWTGILENPDVEALAALLTSCDERARRLRQSSPFAGVLPDEERRDILRDYEARLA